MAKKYDPKKWGKNRAPISAQAVKSAAETQKFFDSATGLAPVTGGLSEVGQTAVQGVVGGRKVGRDIQSPSSFKDTDMRIGQIMSTLGAVPGVGGVVSALDAQKNQLAAAGEVGRYKPSNLEGTDQISTHGTFAATGSPGTASGEIAASDAVSGLPVVGNLAGIASGASKKAAKKKAAPSDNVLAMMEYYKKKFPAAWKEMMDKMENQEAVSKLAADSAPASAGEGWFD